MKNMRVGFVGVGRMGANMARRLADLGYQVSVIYDRHDVSSLALELGATAAGTLAEVTAQADVIFTVVTDDKAMEEIFTGPESLLKEATGRVFINCATVSPEAQEKAAAAAREAGAFALAASMASSIDQARKGTLYLMVGGDEEVYHKMESLLKDLSVALKHVGGAGDAARFKALVNMVMNINTAGLAEGLGLGAAMGLDLDVLRGIFAETGAKSRVLETDGTDMVTREHDCYFSAAHAAKDSGIANALAREAGVEVPLSLATEKQYRKMEDLGLGGLDKSGIAELTFPGRVGH